MTRKEKELREIKRAWDDKVKFLEKELDFAKSMRLVAMEKLGEYIWDQKDNDGKDSNRTRS